MEREGTVQRYEMDVLRYEDHLVSMCIQITNEIHDVKTKKKTFIKVPVEILKESDVVATDVKVFYWVCAITQESATEKYYQMNYVMTIIYYTFWRKNIENRFVKKSCGYDWVDAFGIKIRNSMLNLILSY